MRGSCSDWWFGAVSGEVATNPEPAAANTIAVTTTTCSEIETTLPARAPVARRGSRGAGSTRHKNDRWTGAGSCSASLVERLALDRTGTGAYS